MCCALVLAVAAVYVQTVRFDFVNFDDPAYVYGNAPVASGLNPRSIAWAFTQVHLHNWHPLTWLSHMADCQAYGLWAGGHHVTSVVLHAATAVLLFLVLARMTGALWPSALTAALWAVHPLRVESVAWVAERKDVVSGLFFMLTLAAYARYARRPFSLAGYSAVLVLFACGLMCKPMLVTLPCVLLLLDWWPLGRIAAPPNPAFAGPHPDYVRQGPRLLRLLGEKVPLFALVAADCVLVTLAQSDAAADVAKVPWATRIANALVATMTYVVQMFAPVDLAPFYPHPGDSLPAWQVAGAAAGLVALTAVAVVRRNRNPYLLVGWLWFLGMLVPVIGIMQVGSQARADRYTYLPQIGLCIALAWGAADLVKAWCVPRLTQAAAALLILAALMAGAWRQTSYWQNSETLWRHTIACTAGNWMAHENLAADLSRQGRIDEAIAHYNAALEIFPTHIEAHYNLATALERLGRTDAAVAHYRHALEFRQEHAAALLAQGLAHFNLGVILDRQGLAGEAVAHFKQAVKLQPHNALAQCNLGLTLQKLQRTDEAVVHYRRCLEIEATDANGRIAKANAHNNLGFLASEQGQTDVAIEHYRAALRLEPRFGVARLNLIDALFAQGRPDAARGECRQALALAAAEHDGPLTDALRERLQRSDTNSRGNAAK